MPDNPVPLREALKEAAEELRLAAQARGPLRERMRRLYRAMDRVNALIEQIPIVFEAREGNGQ